MSLVGDVRFRQTPEGDASVLRGDEATSCFEFGGDGGRSCNSRQTRVLEPLEEALKLRG